jgi:hypothetical protein
MTPIEKERGISRVLVHAVVSMGRTGQTGGGRQDKSGDCRRAHLVGGIGVSRSHRDQLASALAAKLNHFNARNAIAALDRRWSYL